MLTGEQVFSQLTAVTDVSESDRTAVMPFCLAAAAVINARLRPDADDTDSRLLTAAVAVAYSRYLLIRNAAESDVESLKAGDVTISRSSAPVMQAAENFRKTALADASGLLTDDGFLFDSVS